MTPLNATMTRTAPAVPPAEAWHAVLARDAAWDGRFVYAVRSTKIFCRPSCPSRRPRRENVAFYAEPAAAARAGYRACKRCRPELAAREPEAIVRQVEAARRFLEEAARADADRRIRLDDLAREVGISPFHLQRAFKRIVGASPATYARTLRSERLKRELQRGATVSRATYGAGYGSSSRAYAAADEHLGMTPAAYRRGGLGVTIRYATSASPFGRLLVATTERGLCAVTLGDADRTLAAALKKEYPAARIVEDDGALAATVSAVLAHLDGRRPSLALPMDVTATAFQRRVWDALRKIPYGETRTYTDIATALGAPKAVRAVASACASNRLALVVPCHRVLRRDGGLGGYRWGEKRKARLLEAERRGP